MWRVTCVAGVLCVLMVGCGRAEMHQGVEVEEGDSWEVGTWRSTSLTVSNVTPQEQKPSKTPDVPDVPDIPDIPEPLRLGECPLELAWWNENDVHQYASNDFGFSKDQRSVIVPEGGPWHRSLSFYNVSTGQGMYPLLEDESFERARFDVSVDVSVEGTTVVVSKDQEESFRVPGQHFRLSGDQSMLATAICLKDGSGTLELWDVAREEVELSQPMTWVCESHWNRMLHLDVAHDGRAVAFYEAPRRSSEEASPRVVVLTQGASGAWEMHHAALPKGFLDAPYELLANLAFHRGTQLLSVINSDGERVIYDPFKRDVVHQEARGSFVANFDTYDYSRPTSPLAWSAHTSVEASVNAKADVELRSSFDGELLVSLVLNQEDQPKAFGRNTTPLPISLAFSEDGTHLVALYRQGIGMWRCVGSDVPSESRGIENLEVEVEVTSRQNHMSLLVKPQVQGKLSGRGFGYRAWVNGVWQRPWVTKDGLSIHVVDAPESFNLVVEADDGHIVLRHESTHSPGSP